MSVNRAILVGNVGKDPDIRYVEGKPVASFSLATTERAFTTATGVNIPEKTEWHNIVMWGKNAEYAEKYIRKGAKLYIEGKIRTRICRGKQKTTKEKKHKVFPANRLRLSTITVARAADLDARATSPGRS